jgi:hypothetical protein
MVDGVIEQSGPIAGELAPAEVATVGREGLLGRLQARAVAVPAAVWLAALVLVSAVDLVVFGRRVVGPWILPDELIYSELAKSLAASGALEIRGVPTGPYSVLYSILISPAYALFDEPARAYAAIKVMNAVLMSLAAIPAYFLARRVLSSGWAVAAAGLAVALPSTTYTADVMTENAFYPVFVTFLLALVLMLERPTVGRQALVLALLGVAFLIRTQAVALVPAVVLAVVAMAFIDGRRDATTTRAAIGRYWPTLTALFGGFIGVAMIEAARGRSAVDVLGPYAASVEHYSILETARWTLYHLAELDLYLGVLPVAAAIVLLPTALRRHESSRALGAFVAVTVSVTACMTVIVGATSTVQPGGYPELPPRVHERYLFYVAPLFLILALRWAASGLRRPGKLALGAALVAALLPATVPYGDLVHTASESLAAIPWTGGDMAHAGLWVLLPTALLAMAFLVLPRRWAVAVPLILLVNFYGVRALGEANVQEASRSIVRAGITVDHGWIDSAVGSDAAVAVLWDGRGRAFAGSSDQLGAGHGILWRRNRIIWENEFFNRSVGRVYYLGRPMLYDLAADAVTVDDRGVVRDATGRAARPTHVLAFAGTRVRGQEVARDPRAGIVLYRVRGPLRLAHSTLDVEQDPRR